MSQNGLIFCIWGFSGTLTTNITVRTCADHLLRLYPGVAEQSEPASKEIFSLIHHVTKMYRVWYQSIRLDIANKILKKFFKNFIHEKSLSWKIGKFLYFSRQILNYFYYYFMKFIMMWGFLIPTSSPSCLVFGIVSHFSTDRILSELVWVKVCIPNFDFLKIHPLPHKLYTIR